MAGNTKFIFGAMVVSALLPVAFVSGVALADGPQQVGTASKHAGFAAAATDMKDVQKHMHHVLNCLVGPNGKGFDESFGNPCNGQGQGAIPETADAATKTKLESALTTTRQAVATSDMAAAKKGASDVAGMLK
jgi:hypothetical protein